MSDAREAWEAMAGRHLVLGRGVTFSATPDGMEARVLGRAVPLSGAEPHAASLFLAPVLASDVVSTLSSSIPSEVVQRAVVGLLERGILEEHRAASAPVPSVFNPETLGDPAILSDVAGALAGGRAVIVPNAFRPELAEEVRAWLTASTEWQEEQYFGPDRPYFQFHRHTIVWPLVMPQVLRDVAHSLGAPESKAFMQALAGVDCSGRFVMTAASNRAGDYSLPHNDDNGLRTLTYIWYVSKGWRPDWGGHLVWCPTGSMVTPEFNSLVLFRVHRGTLHFVTPVAPHAPGGRLSVSGWWHRAAAVPDGMLATTTLGGIHLTPGVYGEPTGVIGARRAVVAL
ncbi:MAG TPA: 2OG-Fe(II) oxygenase family protein [Polyangiaceae bacterium]